MGNVSVIILSSNVVLQQNPRRNVCSQRFNSCLRIETMPVSKTLTPCLFHEYVIYYFYLQQTRCRQYSFLYVFGFGKWFFKNVLFLRIRFKNVLVYLFLHLLLFLFALQQITLPPGCGVGPCLHTASSSCRRKLLTLKTFFLYD